MNCLDKGYNVFIRLNRNNIDDKTSDIVFMSLFEIAFIGNNFIEEGKLIYPYKVKING